MSNKSNKLRFLFLVILPIIIFIVFNIVVLNLINRSENDYLLGQDENDFQKSALLIQDSIDQSVVFARSIEALFLVDNKVSNDDFVQFAHAVAQNSTSEVTLEWLDTNNIIQNVYPITDQNLAVIGTDINKFPNRLIPITKAKETKQSVLTDPIRLVQGYPGVILYVPIYKNNQYMGMAISVIRLSDLSKNIDINVLGNNTLTIRTSNFIIPISGKEIYTSNGERVVDSSGKLEIASVTGIYKNIKNLMTYDLSFSDKIWKLQKDPYYITQVALTTRTYGYVSIFIIFGFFVLLFINYNSQIYLRNEYKKETVLRENLENEIKQRLQVENTLREQNTSLVEAKNSISKNMEDIKKIDHLMIDRELKMIDLKKEIDTLKQQDKD